LEDLNLFFRFGVALVIGILVGLQREFSFEERDVELFAGVRTFALMGLLGCSGAYISDLSESPWPLISIILSLGILLGVTHYVDATKGKVGLTTEIAAVLTVIAGALAYMEQVLLAVALGVTITVLLSVKVEAQTIVRHLNREDIFAILKFAVVAAVVLPLLPNVAYGPPPFDVFNPYTIWLLVVLISAISFVGYILNKLIGAEKGIGLIGFLGGLASSTAVTLNFTQRSKVSPSLSRAFALAILIAWTVMFSRVLVQAVLVNRALLGILWLPMVASVLVGLVYSLYLYFSQTRSEEREQMEFENPFELGPAIKFGLLFAVILFISRAAQIYLDASGIYLSALVSGIADVNAITLSMAQLSLGGRLDLQVAARAIVLATVANTIVKGAIVLLGGSRSLRLAILPGYVLMTATGMIVAFLV
jgi:uncharacterized membrane protein (DUF4010 family)